MRDLWTVTQFTMKDMLQRKSFIITTIIFLIMIVVGFNIPNFMKMLNKLLCDKNYPTISVGIGMSTAEELVVKAGRKDVGINSKVWIGKAVTTASNLSSLGRPNL